MPALTAKDDSMLPNMSALFELYFTSDPLHTG